MMKSLTVKREPATNLALRCQILVQATPMAITRRLVIIAAKTLGLVAAHVLNPPTRLKACRTSTGLRLVQRSKRERMW